MSKANLEIQEGVKYISIILLCTFLFSFLRGKKKEKYEKKKETRFLIIGLVDVNRLDKSSNELWDCLY